MVFYSRLKPQALQWAVAGFRNEITACLIYGYAVIHGMYTVVETEVFLRAASGIWMDAERTAFINWLAM